MPKIIVEDIEWAVEVISGNRLYSGNMDSLSSFEINKPEIKAWLDHISMKQIPKNHEEIMRLQEYEDLHKQEN